MLNISPIVLAVVEIVMGVLTIIAWMEHIKGMKVPDWAPEGWAMHIKSIILPDVLMIAAFFASGWMLFMGDPLGIKLAIMGGGMLLYLCLLSVSYNVQNGLYDSKKGGTSLIVPDIIMCVVGVFITYGGIVVTLG